jgi:hypothetical protein
MRELIREDCLYYQGYFLTDDLQIYNAKARRFLKLSKDDDGYVRLWIKDRAWFRYSLVCYLHHGPPPFKGAVVKHRNHIPDDDRPDNLLWGSQADNVADMIAAGRQSRGFAHSLCKALGGKTARGERVGTSVYTEDVIKAAYLDWKLNGGPRRRLMKYGISLSTIHKVCAKLAWKYLTDQVDREVNNA